MNTAEKVLRDHAEQLKRQLIFQKIATEVSALFAGVRSREELDGVVNSTLRILGEFFQTDRSYIFQFAEDGRTMSNTHEWCSPSTTPHIDELQDLAVDHLPWWNQQITTRGLVHLPSIDDLPVDAQAEREEFRSQHIQSLLAVPMHGSNGRVMGFFGLDMVHKSYRWSEDEISMITLLAGITGNAMERLQAVVALLESEARHRIAFEQSRDAIATIAPPSWRFTSGNPAAIELFGAKSIEEFLSLEPTSLAPNFQPDGQESSRKAQDMIGTAMRDGSSYFEWTQRRVDGAEFHATVLMSRMQAAGQTYLQCVIRDVTERKRAEARERALQEQVQHVRRLEALGQLTGGIAHDFNNLLTVIQGNSELIQMAVDQTSPIAPLVEDMVRAAQQGSELTQALLAFARRQTLEPAVVDLNLLVTDMRGLLGRTLGQNIEVILELDDNPPAALVDRAQLESGLLNLCLNSRDAMPHGGQLTIRTALCKSQNSEDEHVTLTVQDTGYGVPAENLPRLLEPFFTTKPKGKGTGLGLPMVYGFVKQSDGKLEIESTPGVGTTVHLHLPIAKSAATPVEVTASQGEAPGGTETILLAEDDEMVRKYTHKLLTNLGYTVLLASSGAEALERARGREDIDLLFTDVVMPGDMNGRELAEAIRKFLPDLPVLFTSGYTEGVMHEKEDGIDLILKPYRRGDLAKRIRSSLDRSPKW